MAHAPIRVEPAFRRADWVVFALASAVGLAAIYGFFAYWWALDAWGRHPALLGVVSLVLLAQVAMQQIPWWMLLRMRRPIPPKLASGSRVGVAVTFVPDAEPLDMLEETVRALVAMDYAHETWVLDEGDDDAVKALCTRLGARHFTRRHLPAYRTPAGRFKDRTKYGNVNAWLEEVAYGRFDFVVSFDPDHTPRPEFLTRVLGYFEDERVGYVQAAQVYYNQDASFIARGAAEETYAYYSSLQMSSFGFGYPIITGCHNAHRATALREVGGFAPHDADDLLLTLEYRTRGWRGVYVPEVLAHGLTPVDWPGYLTQQQRWARSVLDIKLNRFPGMAGELPRATRLTSFLHGLAYVQESLQAPISIAILFYLLAVGGVPLVSYLVAPPALAMLAALLGMQLYTQRFFLEPRREWGFHWRAGLLRLAKWPQVLLALGEAIARRDLPFAITRKRAEGTRQPWVLRPQLGVALLTAAAWATGALRGADVEPLVHAAALLVIAANLGFFLSQLRRFPPPYDAALQRSAEAKCGLQPLATRQAGRGA